MKDLERTLEGTMKDGDKLRSIVKESEQEILELLNYKSMLHQQEMRIKEYEQCIVQHEDRVLLLSQEISRLNLLLKAKNEEIVRLEDDKISSYGLATQCKQFEGDLEEKDHCIHKLKFEIESCHQTITEFTEVDRKTQHEFREVSDMTERINSELRSKNE